MPPVTTVRASSYRHRGDDDAPGEALAQPSIEKCDVALMIRPVRRVGSHDTTAQAGGFIGLEKDEPMIRGLAAVC